MAISKRSPSPIVTASVLVVSFLLSSCHDRDQGSPEQMKVAGSADVAASVPVTAFTAYKPEAATGVITTCNIEALDQTSFQQAPTVAALSAPHLVSGWIAAPQMTASTYWLRMDDKVQGNYLQAKIVPSIKRPDVPASSSSNPPLPLNSGFKLELPAHAVPAGQYHLYLAASGDGKLSICDDGRQVDLR